MNSSREWFVQTDDGKVYGPADVSALIEWAKEGRIEPTCYISQDRLNWKPAQLMPELQMTWLIETEPGKFFGPFTREVVSRLSREGALPRDYKAYRQHAYPIDQDAPPVEKIVEVPVEKIVEKIVNVPVEKIVEKEVRVEVPVEKIVKQEVRVEVPVEKIVEKVVEKVVEVPVEKIVEKIIEVEPPPRAAIVAPKVVEPAAQIPPKRAPGAIFGGMNRERMAALEAAAQRELARKSSIGSSNASKFSFSANLFGRKK